MHWRYHCLGLSCPFAGCRSSWDLGGIAGCPHVLAAEARAFEDRVGGGFERAGVALNLGDDEAALECGEEVRSAPSSLTPSGPGSWSPTSKSGPCSAPGLPAATRQLHAMHHQIENRAAADPANSGGSRTCLPYSRSSTTWGIAPNSVNIAAREQPPHGRALYLAVLKTDAKTL
jgi:hypothetical protein